MTHLDEALSDGANATKRDLVDYLEAVADRMRAESSHREVRYALCEDKPTLIWLANQRAVEYNVTLGTAEHLDRPSYLVLDIDPPAAGEFGRAVAAARLVREALSEAGLAGDQDQQGQGRAHLCARSRASEDASSARLSAFAIAVATSSANIAMRSSVSDGRRL